VKVKSKLASLYTVFSVCFNSINVEVETKMDHTIIHFEIPANNVEKNKAIYEKVFWWKIVLAEGPIEYGAS
jgi:hypothetical protein